MDEYFLTVAEIAEMLRVNQQTVRNWIDRSELPAVRVGKRRVRVRRSDLDAFVAAGSTASASDAEPEAPDLNVLRGDLDISLERARSSLADDTELADSLRSLADAAARLATAIEHRGDTAG